MTQQQQVYSNEGLLPETGRWAAKLRSLGVSLSATHVSGYEAWARRGKRTGWWAALARFHAPVWGAAAPNAVDLINPSISGTWVGSVTFTGKKACSPGANGYFNSGWVNPSPVGAVTRQGIYVNALTIPSEATVFAAAYTSGSAQIQLDGYLGREFFGSGASSILNGGSLVPGGLLGYSNGSTIRLARCPTGSTFTLITSAAAAGDAATATPIFMGFNNNGTPTFLSTAEFAAFALLNAAISDPVAADFMNASNSLVTALRT